MKKKHIAIGIAVLGLIALLTYGWFFLSPRTQHHDSGAESREVLLNQSIAATKGQKWTIAAERSIDPYIISSAYSTDNRAAIAVFEPDGRNRYHLMSSVTGNQDEIITDTIVMNGEAYNLIWFNGAQTEYAEVIYVINGEAQKPLRYDTGNMEVICEKAPAKEYEIRVTYYDSLGNQYHS